MNFRKPIILALAVVLILLGYCNLKAIEVPFYNLDNHQESAQTTETIIKPKKEAKTSVFASIEENRQENSLATSDLEGSNSLIDVKQANDQSSLSLPDLLAMPDSSLEYRHNEKAANAPLNFEGVSKSHEESFLPLLMNELEIDRPKEKQLTELEKVKPPKQQVNNKETANVSEKESIYTQPLFLETESPNYSVHKTNTEAAPEEELEFLQEGVLPKGSVEHLDDKATVPILTPSLAKRIIRKIRLGNTLEVYLISDPDSNKSGAALSVEAGTWSNPEDFPGMAHFLEHMLFLGTEKYPEESGFKRFISTHNGQTNAYTSEAHTNYGFAISHNAFKEALDRFAQLFTSPLLTDSGIERELTALNQEFEKSIENDHIRRSLVLKELGNKYHPMKNFNFGNSESLKDITAEKVRTWFHENYSANLMHLALISDLPIDELKDIAIETFSNIPNRNLQAISPQTTITSPTYDGHIVFIEALKDERKLSLQWELSTEFAYDEENRSMAIVSYVIGHEGEQSLLAQLKREKLALNLSSGGMKIGPNNALFSIEIGLTDEGLKNVDTVIERCFQAISHYKSNGIPPYLFEEVQHLAKLNYQYQSRGDLFDSVMFHSRHMIDEDITTYPERTMLFEKFNPRAVRRLFSELSPDHSQVTIQAQGKHLGVKLDRNEQWMGTEYTVQPIPDRKLTAWYNVSTHPAIDLPVPNPFFPDSLEIVNRPSASRLQPHPITLIDEESGRIYFSADTHYLTPEISWNFLLRSPEINNSIRNSVLLDLYIIMIKEKLNAISYQASLAGISYHLKASRSIGLEFSIEGFSTKAHIFLQEILNHMKEDTIDEDLFDLYKDSLSETYSNFSHEPPIEQSIEIMSSLIRKNYSTQAKKAHEINNIRYEDFNKFISSLLNEVHTEGLLYGNMTTSQARDAWDRIVTTLAAKPFVESRHQQSKIIVMPKSVGPFYIVERTERQGNAIVLMLQQGPFTFKNRAAQQILNMGIEEPFFSTLRTQQQTAYIIWNWSQEIERQLFSFFAVQSSTHNVRDLLARFELFLEDFLQDFDTKKFPEKNFDTLKNVLLTELHQPKKSLLKMGTHLKVLAFEYDADFDWMAKRIQGFEELNYQEFSELAKASIGRRNKQRLAILMKGSLAEENSFFYYRVNATDKMRKISSYITREEQELYQGIAR